MIREHATFDREMSAALRDGYPEDIPLDTDVWPTIRARIAAAPSVPRQGGRRFITGSIGRVGVVVMAAGFLAISSLALATAASPGLRHVLTRAAQQIGLMPGSSGLAFSDGRFHDLQPVPSFRVLYPPTQFPGVPVASVGQIRSSAQGPGTIVAPIGSFECPQTDSACLHIAHVIKARGQAACNAETACLALSNPFPVFRYPTELEAARENGIATVYFWFGAVPPDTSYLHLIEQPAGTSASSAGAERLVIDATTVYLQHIRDSVTLRFTYTGTEVTITTDRGLSSAIAAARSLLGG